MPSVNDVGGLRGFGTVARESGEPVFHAPWEGRVFAIEIALRAGGLCDAAEFRHGVERLHPRHYFNASYYERWLDAIEWVLAEHGVLASGAVQARARQPERTEKPAEPDASRNALRAKALALVYGASSRRVDTAELPQLHTGEMVRCVRSDPPGHVRLPRYVQGARGAIASHLGAFPFPGAIAEGRVEPQHLYTVTFAAAELWGDHSEPNTRVLLDLYESYLVPAGKERC